MESYLQRAVKSCIGKCVPDSARRELGIPESNRKPVETQVNVPGSAQASSTNHAATTAESGCQCQIPWVTNAVSMDHMASFRDVRAHDVQLSLGLPTSSSTVQDVAVQVQLPAVWAPCGELQIDRRRVVVQRVTKDASEAAPEHHTSVADLKTGDVGLSAAMKNSLPEPVRMPAVPPSPLLNHQRLDRRDGGPRCAGGAHRARHRLQPRLCSTSSSSPQQLPLAQMLCAPLPCATLPC